MFRVFELFVAMRYLRAKRRETAISLVTAISVVGVAAGVAALIVALAINSGFRNTLQRNLLGATAHVSILEKVPQYGIENWQSIAAKLRTLPGVATVSPTLYSGLYVMGPITGTGAILKGVPPDQQPSLEALSHLKSGSFDRLKEDQGPGLIPVILGSEVAKQLGLKVNDRGSVISPTGELTPLGPRPMQRRFRVVGIFESGFYALDSGWAFTSLDAARRVMSSGDVVNSIEVNLTNPDHAPAFAQAAASVIGNQLVAETWQEQNKQLLGALKMERIVTITTIGLIQLIAALNILIALTMMVMEKRRGIAVLMSMGATQSQIRNVFLLQGSLIGTTGTIIGLIIGYTVAIAADKGQWLRLDEAVYTLPYVPFETRWVDGLWIAAVAIGISVLATLWPANNATKISPVETLRYE